MPRPIEGITAPVLLWSKDVSERALTSRSIARAYSFAVRPLAIAISRKRKVKKKYKSRNSRLYLSPHGVGEMHETRHFSIFVLATRIGVLHF